MRLTNLYFSLTKWCFRVHAYLCLARWLVDIRDSGSQVYHCLDNKERGAPFSRLKEKPSLYKEGIIWYSHQAYCSNRR
jgi:hypothetical protein